MFHLNLDKELKPKKEKKLTLKDIFEIKENKKPKNKAVKKTNIKNQFKHKSTY